jgi:hypothetical protein
MGKAPRHKGKERFLKGPVPWDWLCAAAAAAGRGSGLQVALALWHISGLHYGARTIKLSRKVLRELNVTRHAGYRGLEALEAANLVSVVRKPGQQPTVTILPAGRGAA